MTDPIKNRYDFVLFFDVENGNPNGDPDAGNMPRVDPETGIGIVSDVCLKRKVRNYVELTRESEGGFRIYVHEGSILNERHHEAYEATGIKADKKTKVPKKVEEQRAVTRFMCDNFYDIRTFGAVMTTGDEKCGQVRGPIQICFAQSVDPVVPQEMSITRMAATNRNEETGENRTMGRKQYIPYGLYRAEGFVSASLAQKTGFSQDDLDLFWEALMNMFEDDRSAARGLMTSRRLYVFRHESKLGNAPARSLFDLVSARKVVEGPTRQFSDYELGVDKESLPQGVYLSEYEWIQPKA